MRNNGLCLTCVGLLWAMPVLAAASDATLDPNSPCTAERGEPVTYDVDFSVVVTPPYKCQKLRVWLALPQTDDTQEVTEGALDSFPLKVEPQIETEPVYGNRFAYFEYRQPKGAQIIRHKFRVKVHELRWNIDPDKIVKVDEWPDSFAPYLRSERQSVVIDERVGLLGGQIVPRPENAARDLISIMSWVDGNLKYTHETASLRASSLHALDQRMGHCSDYHGLCAAFGRSLGYPTRVAYGINPFPKNSPSHCKLEAYLPPYGWVSFDVSETQKLVASIEKEASLDDAAKQRLADAAYRRLHRGFRDNTWFIQTRGTDYELAPPAANRAPVVRTIYAEADGVPLPDPDPASKTEQRFAWMTVHEYQSDRQVPNPFKDWATLAGE